MATFGTFVAGQVLTAAELNTAGAWFDYTPSWTQSATISKTVNFARYTQLGKWVQGAVKMTATSAGTANNKILVGLPVNASANNFIIGNYIFIDDSVTHKFVSAAPVFYDSINTMSFYPVTTNGFFGTNDVTDRLGENYTDAASSRTGPAVASGDIIYVQFMYEAA